MFGYLYSSEFLHHNTGDHLEVARRCEAIDEMVEELFFDVDHIPVRVGGKEELLAVHDDEYIDWIESGYDNGVRMIISSDTIVSADSYDVALMAATSTKNVIDYFKSGAKRAFLNLRPPGHHAEVITGQGFCIFNNVAMMARYAQDAGYSRVLIVDFDVHHGNGTQDIFYDDSSVFYFSTHERNNYPFSGTEDEIGEGRGEGFNLNIPYENGIDDEEFVSFFDRLPSDFNPDIVLVSAGYDMMADEVISSSNISFDGLRKVVNKILVYSDNIPIAFTLEGGYNIDSLTRSVQITMEELAKR